MRKAKSSFFFVLLIILIYQHSSEHAFPLRRNSNITPSARPTTLGQSTSNSPSTPKTRDPCQGKTRLTINRFPANQESRAQTPNILNCSSKNSSD